MKNFNRGGEFSKRKDGGSFGRRDSGNRGFNRGGGDSGRPAMHKAVCAQCGQSCEVPFKPTGDKPVFCSNCFKGKDGLNAKRPAGRDFGQPNFNDKKLFSAICDKCGQSCEVPFKPSAGKPVYCSECFSKGDNAKNKNSFVNNKAGANTDTNANVSSGNNSAGEQFAILNAKLDKILRALGPIAAMEPIVKKETSVGKVTNKEADKVVKKPEVKSGSKKISGKLSKPAVAKVAAKVRQPKKPAKK